MVNGAGASAIACVDLIKKMGMPNENVTLCDSRGVIYRGREDGMNQWKSAHAVETNVRDLEQALKGADVFIGLSTKDVVSQDMVKSMAEKPRSGDYAGGREGSARRRHRRDGSFGLPEPGQ